MKEHFNSSLFYKQLQTKQLCTCFNTGTLCLVALL
jgi:hypothetical protein